MGHKRPRDRRQRGAGGPGLEGSDCGPGRGGGLEGAGRGGTQERPRRRTRAGWEHRAAQWGSSLQAEGSCVLTGSALRLRGLNTLGQCRAGTPVRPAPDPRPSVPPTTRRRRAPGLGGVRSPVPSKAVMSGGGGGGGPSSGRAGLASGWGHRPAAPQFLAEPRHPGRGQAAPASAHPAGSDAARIPGQPPQARPRRQAWPGAAHSGAALSAPSTCPAVSAPTHRACGLVPAEATPPPHARTLCPSRLLCCAGSFPGLTQSSCQKAPDCRPRGSSTW